ncbi:MAG: CarD family transcriptional regulator [bacterium]|nr:CarD family transcriptional regulator [bacterium]
MTTRNMAEGILITAITPYFLEKEEGWLAQNREKILASRAVNPFFQEHTLLLENGGSFPISQLLLNLDTMGYEKVFHVQYPGEFSNRGNIVEVFPLFTPCAFRVEFLGNTIDQIEQLAIFIEDEEASKKVLQKRLKSQKTFSDLSSLKEGDFLVHLDHGVARFMGIETLRISPEQTEQMYKLEYAAGDTLYVPIGLERKLSRYVGFEDPRISRLGSSLWIKTKKKAREDIEKLAKSLLKTYTEREVAQRPPYPLPDDIDATIEASFPYQETADQVQALQEIHQDLSQKTPMDRIVCGDVGFGKTEIALRAMVRVAKTAQTALLCPTTILAHQHFQTFQKRLGDLPFRVAMLSRLQKPSEQKAILKGLANGTIDIVIGTHRLLSKDIVFRNLGLLVIDDEHRFGVKQKEKLKDLRSSLDILSLSATPIPRTMHMALSSLRKVSMVQTPPEGRVPSSTIIAKRTQSTIKKAILQELERGGQVYYLHNRIASMGRIITFLSRLVPKARIGHIHGRMREQNLIATLDAFRNKEYDVLVATTIIENGLHLPQVNTIIVEEASKIGLAQAYQLRGRVGRSDIPAFSYFLHGSSLGEQAKARLEALSELQDLGSGYRLALRDMEIRGAGNLLGKEQSGTVNAVGLNLYCQMLSESVERLRSLQSPPS